MSSSLYLQLRCETLQSVLPTFMSTLHASYCNANLNTLAVTLFTNSGHCIYGDMSAKNVQKPIKLPIWKEICFSHYPYLEK